MKYGSAGTGSRDDSAEFNTGNKTRLYQSTAHKHTIIISTILINRSINQSKNYYSFTR